MAAPGLAIVMAGGGWRPDQIQAPAAPTIANSSRKPSSFFMARRFYSAAVVFTAEERPDGARG